jgi:hypothetical protein
MNPTLTQIVEHPEFGCIMPQAVAFAAMGTNDKTVNAHRKAGRLLEGEHFVRIPQRSGMPRLHWTIAGLQALAINLNTERAKGFLADLNEWLQSRSAIEHQPRGYAAPVAMQADYEPAPAPLGHWQQPEPLAVSHDQEQPLRDSYSLPELEAMKAIAQAQRDGQMLALLDKAISSLTANQSAEKVIHVQPQKPQRPTTNINIVWNWRGGSHNGGGSVEAFFVVALALILISGWWLVAVSANHRQPLYNQPPTSWRG